ncbi:BTAD domain-containing putative transcriptional regulator [Streptomyces sp. 184]|uniref:AfsR/SARP family transcriptional regulator n=1 Tax=Streptomyces sp. 184 TaxID=1827526 RepID=UPI0038916F38
MEFKLLGPLELWSEDRRLPVGTPQERTVLASLLWVVGGPVSVEVLMSRLWGTERPPSAPEVLQANVSRLRNRLRAAADDRLRITFAGRAYRLEVDPETIDLHRFRRLYRQGKAVAGSGSPEQAVTLLTEAESLWRGEPLGGLRGHWVTSLRHRVGEERRRVQEVRVDLELGLGRHADLVGELCELAERHPTNEPIAAQLMVALYRSGRHGESLDVFQRIRRDLRDTLGLSPGNELSDLQQRILSRDPALLEPEFSRSGSPKPDVSDTMPRDTPDFVGRDQELRLIVDDVRRRSTALPLFVVHGMPGVGKTTLVVHAAHLLREQFPNGMQYVDLRAHSRDGHLPRDPSEVLATLLQAVGAGKGLPSTLDERASRWRERLAHRRMLLVLDDARDAAQIRPLLPGTPNCSVIVTSRHRMAELEGARSIALDVPPAGEAVALFTRIVGATRSRDTAGVLEVTRLYGHHPLAVQLTANRFRHREVWSVRDLADSLTRAGEPSGEFDASAGIAAVFALSYAELSDGCQRLFRRLSLHPGPDLTLDAAVALSGKETAAVRGELDELLEYHLVEELVRDRYVVHSLVRAFAGRMGRLQDSAEVRRRALSGLFDYYLAAAEAAVQLTHPQRRKIPMSVRPAEPALPFSDGAAAQAWLDVERANLVAVIRYAATESPQHARILPLLLSPAFRTWGVWQTAADLYATALSLSRGASDLPSVARTLVERSEVLWRLGLRDEALPCADEAMACYGELNDDWGLAEAQAQRALVDLVSGEFSQAIRKLELALALHRQVGNIRGEAETLTQQAVALSYTGQRREALMQTRTALHLFQEIGDRLGELKALNNIGETERLEGNQEEARTYYERALVLQRQVGGRQELAILYNNLGNLCRTARDTAAALDYYREALKNYRAISDLRCEADSLINIGLTFAETMRHTEADIHFTMAERIAKQIGDSYQWQRALAGKAAALHGSGRRTAARSAYEKALQKARAIGASHEEALAAEGLGALMLELQDDTAARQTWLHALALYERLGLAAESHALRQRLAVYLVDGEQGATSAVRREAPTEPP